MGRDVITVRFGSEFKASIDAMAQMRGMNRSDMMRRLCEWALLEKQRSCTQFNGFPKNGLCGSCGGTHVEGS